MSRWVIGLFLCLFATGCAHKKHTAPPVVRESANIEYGMKLLEAGNYHEAKRHFENAIRVSPNSPYAFSAMGYFYAKTGDAKLAHPFYDRSIALAPHSARILYNYGAFLCSTNRPQEGVNYMEKSFTYAQKQNLIPHYLEAASCAASIPSPTLTAKFYQLATQYPNQSMDANGKLAEMKFEKHEYNAAHYYLNNYFMLSKKPNRQMIEMDRIIGNQLKDKKIQKEAILLAKRFYPKPPVAKRKQRL